MASIIGYFDFGHVTNVSRLLTFSRGIGGITGIEYKKAKGPKLILC